MQEFQSKNAEKLAAAGKAIGEAFQKNDKEAIAKAQKAYQEAYAPVHQAMKESQKKLDEILTPQQREKQADHQATTWIKAMTDPIELSEEQKKKAKAAYRELQKAPDYEATGASCRRSSRTSSLPSSGSSSTSLGWTCTSSRCSPTHQAHRRAEQEGRGPVR